MPDKPFFAGQPFEPSASQFNRWNQAARGNRDAGGRGDPRTAPLDADIFLALNNTGGALGFGAIVAVTPNFFASAGDENAAEYQYRPSFTAAAPASGDEDKFAIYQEPVAAGAAGMIRLAGVAICQLLINDLADEFAAAVAADTAKLSSGQSGGARILYLETGKVATDTAWAVVRIGDGGGGGESYPDYDAGKVQLLGHDDSGVKRWYDVNDTEC